LLIATPAVFTILNSERIGVTTWPFGVMWRHQSRDHAIHHGLFPTGGRGLLKRSLYLQPFSRYWALSILWSRVWPYGLTWRYRSRGHSIPHTQFPIDGHLEPSIYL